MKKNNPEVFSFRMIRVRNVSWKALEIRIALEGSLVLISLILRSLVDDIFGSSFCILFCFLKKMRKIIIDSFFVNIKFKEK